MKRWMLFTLILCTILSGCVSAPVPTTAPTTLPEPSAPGLTLPFVTIPTATTEEAPLPEDTFPSTVPTEPEFTSYTIRVEDPEQLIYEAPGFRHRCTAAFGEAGTYTIVEEARDWDGNLWGRLKSGIGWVCLTEPAIVPVYADYAPEGFAYEHSWHCGEAEYVTDMGIIPMERITNVQFTLLNVIENYGIEEVLYALPGLDAEEAVLFSAVFWGDMTTYGLSFTDAKGNQRYFTLSVSGRDGSLICSEYTP